MEHEGTILQVEHTISAGEVYKELEALKRLQEKRDEQWQRVVNSYNRMNERLDQAETNVNVLAIIKQMHEEPKITKTYANQHQTSPEINELCASLAKAHGEMVSADATGKGAKGKAVSIEDLRNVMRVPFANHGLAVLFFIENDEFGEGSCRMKLVHESGQFMEDRLRLMVDNIGTNIGDWHQKRTSAITYTIKHMLRGIVGGGDTEQVEEQV